MLFHIYLLVLTCIIAMVLKLGLLLRMRTCYDSFSHVKLKLMMSAPGSAAQRREEVSELFGNKICMAEEIDYDP